MITKEQVLPLLFSSCPAIEKSTIWQEHIKSWENDEDRGLYLDASAVANYIIEKYKNKDTAEFPAFFDFVEKLHTEGDAYVKELASIGFLEDLSRSLEKKEKDEISSFLKPVSQKWWNYLEKFWAGKLTEKYKWFQERTTEIVNAADPWYLVQGGAPKDEYSQEVAKIIAGMKNCETEQDVEQLVLKHLGGTDSNEKACKLIASELYKMREQILFSKE